MKNKKLEEIFGEEKAIEIKRKISLKRTISKEKIIKEFKEKWNKYNGFFKKDFDRLMSCNVQTVRNKFGSLNNLAGFCGVEFKSVNKDIFGHKGREGIKEKKILDIVEKRECIKLKRQFIVFGKKGVYYLDGYDINNNVVYEYDEKNHNYQQVYDYLREKDIKSVLNCSFKRINYKDIDILNSTLS